MGGNRLKDELCPDKPFPEIVDEARQSEYAACVDVNDSAFLAPVSMKDAFDDRLDREHQKPRTIGDYFRCAFNSLAESYKTALDELWKNSGKDFDTLYIVGGGAKNGLLNELTETVCRIRVKALPIEATWVQFAKEIGLDGLDFNPTMFSHVNMKDGLSLSSPDEKIRKFWVKHCIACLKIAEYFATEMHSHCLVNIWIPDGYKDVPADRLSPRLRLKKSLDEILACGYDKSKVVVAVESKVFGIGIESYTVGSNEFYQNYAANNGICCLLDNGHYHPLEYVSDKIPSLLAFYDRVALHVTRGVRWDSDHVVLFEDELKEIAKEIVRNGATDKMLIGLDYFDAGINRLAAWIVGARNMQKALCGRCCNRMKSSRPCKRMRRLPN